MARHERKLVVLLIIAFLIGVAVGRSGAPVEHTSGMGADVVTAWFESHDDGTYEGIMGAADQRPAYAVDVVRLEVKDTDPTVVAALTALGAWSDPTDGCECVYAPAGAHANAVDGGTWVVTPTQGLVQRV